MAPYTNLPLSPAELSYLHTSLASTPPIRPDGRTATQFRPLVAETDILPSANGSARVCFADGTEAVVGVKAEVEKTKDASGGGVSGESVAEGVRGLGTGGEGDVDMDDEDEDTGNGGVSLRSKEEEDEKKRKGKGEEGWVDVSIEIPGMRDDDALPVFLAAMLTEALTAEGEGLKDRLWINNRFHWRLYVDILLLSQPLSYPLPLLSLTTHLALLSTRLPALISEKDEDPLFNDDWEASTYLYPRSKTANATAKPPITLLVMSVGENIIFDPSRDELAVADAVFAISASPSASTSKDQPPLKLISLRTIDPPSRLTAAGVPTALNATSSAAEALAMREKDQGRSVWRPPRGGVKRAVVARMVRMVVEKGGVGQEVLEGVEGVET